LHIRTAADDFVLREARARKVVFVTGNPGDGKTHLLRRHAEELAAAGVTVCLDANEKPDEELIQLVDAAITSESGAAIAINQGILVELLSAASGRQWASDARSQLLQPFNYVTQGAESANSQSVTAAQVIVADLNLRNNLGASVVNQALARLVDLSSSCDLCREGACTGVKNAERLSDVRIAGRVQVLLELVSKSGVHATMRDLQAFLSFLIYGGRRCETEPQEGGEAAPYWVNAFENGIGSLFDAVRRLDPAQQPSPVLDDVLWRHADRGTDWALPFDEVLPYGEGIELRRRSFLARKRRAVFEHRDGGRLLVSGGSGIDRLFRSLTGSGVNQARSVVRMLNRFFDKDEEQDDLLILWVSHRYDARSSRYAASAVAVPTNSLEIAVPQLPRDLANAFPDYVPDHLLLRPRDAEDEQFSLSIDRPFLEALYSADQGLPTTFRRGEPEARIAGFYDRLARNAWKGRDGLVKVRFVDIDTGKNWRTAVDVAQRHYQQA
jgi:hypothetical protein